MLSSHALLSLNRVHLMAMAERNVRQSTAHWGGLPVRMRALFVTGSHRTGGWLAEALAVDSASDVILEETVGMAAGSAKLRDELFDIVLVSHEPPELDALELAQGLRAGGLESAILILGAAVSPELETEAYEAGADAYLCADTATTRALLWTAARAIERCRLVQENRRLTSAERKRLEHEHQEADRLLAEQRGLIAELEGLAIGQDCAGGIVGRITGDPSLSDGRSGGFFAFARQSRFSLRRSLAGVCDHGLGKFGGSNAGVGRIAGRRRRYAAANDDAAFASVGNAHRRPRQPQCAARHDAGRSIGAGGDDAPRRRLSRAIRGSRAPAAAEGAAGLRPARRGVAGSWPPILHADFNRLLDGGCIRARALLDRGDDFGEKFIDLLRCSADETGRVERFFQIDFREHRVAGQAGQQIVATRR